MRYKTIQAPAAGSYKEKGSKFLAFAFPVTSEEEVHVCLVNTRKKYFDARHHCYAYVLGKEGNVYRTNDDGEPNHSAGDPILGQIRSYELTNILIVVVRYFGGIKLGVGGLIHAYRAAASDAIDNTEIIETEDFLRFEVKFDYLRMNDVMRIIKDYQLIILEQHFDNSCKIILSVPDSDLLSVSSKLKEIDGLEINE